MSDEKNEEDKEIWRKIGRRAKEKRRRREEREKRRIRLKREKELRKRNLVWREVTGDRPEERRKMVEKIMEKVLVRKVEMRSWEERGGKGLIELKKEKDKNVMLEKGVEIRRK